MDKIPHAGKTERVKFGKIKRGFKSAIDVVDSNNNSEKGSEKLKH